MIWLARKPLCWVIQFFQWFDPHPFLPALGSALKNFTKCTRTVQSNLLFNLPIWINSFFWTALWAFASAMKVLSSTFVRSSSGSNPAASHLLSTSDQTYNCKVTLWSFKKLWRNDSSLTRALKKIVEISRAKYMIVLCKSF